MHSSRLICFGWGQADLDIADRVAHVGQVLGLADIHFQVAGALVLADHHPGIDFRTRAE